MEQSGGCAAGSRGGWEPPVREGCSTAGSGRAAAAPRAPVRTSEVAEREVEGAHDLRQGQRARGAAATMEGESRRQDEGFTWIDAGTAEARAPHTL